jgi:deferrochelatase/peroxidase EfeB
MRWWRAGAPIDVTPLKDDKALGGDPSRNNNFRYDPNSQERCPFAAHTRKTNPRADLPSTEVHRIIRRGIPYGPEVSKDEAASNRSTQQRGLLFVSYQSSIFNGFQFLQESKSLSP